MVKQKPVCGIYLIENNINHHKYIGQSVNIKKRWSSHLNTYNKQGIEYNKPLYRAFRKYGINNFTFTIIEECPRGQLNKKELYWICYYDSYYNGYNCSDSEQPFPMTGEQHFNHKLTLQDVIDIRTDYANHQRCKEVFRKYQDRIGWTGFHKIWKGETWKTVMMEVYTPENIDFHKHNTGQYGSQNGRALLNEQQVYNIRLRKKVGEKPQDVYEDYKYTGITYKSFTNVWYYKNWKNIVVD